MARSQEQSIAVPAACVAAWFVVWASCAISPNDRRDWLLENLLTFAGVGALLATFRRFRFSDRAYVQMTIFMILHAVGGHYTYAEVPLGDWLKDALGLARNHFDRIVHFSFGLLMLRPMRELGFRNDPRLGRFAKLYFATAGVGLWSMVYEIAEWIVAVIVDPAAARPISARRATSGTRRRTWASR